MKDILKKMRDTFTKAAAVKVTLTIPALAGMALLCLGISFFSIPASIIAGGVCLIWLDSRL